MTTAAADTLTCYSCDHASNPTNQMEGQPMNENSDTVKRNTAKAAEAEANARLGAAKAEYYRGLQERVDTTRSDLRDAIWEARKELDLIEGQYEKARSTSEPTDGPGTIYGPSAQRVFAAFSALQQLREWDKREQS